MIHSMPLRAIIHFWSWMKAKGEGSVHAYTNPLSTPYQVDTGRLGALE